MEKIKKVLYISYDGLTDPLGRSQILPYVVGLSEKGYRFTILSFEKKNQYLSEKEKILEINKQASINWQPLSFSQNPPLLSKIYDRWRMMRKAKKLHIENHYDIIHCRSYVAAETGLVLKKNFGTLFLFDMRGFWPDEKVDAGRWNQSTLWFRMVYRFYKRKEKRLLSESDAIITLTSAAKKYLCEQPLYSQLNISVIPCCADLSYFDYTLFSNEQKEQLRLKLGIDYDKKIITYIGSTGGFYLTNEIFSFVKLLLITNPNYFLLFITKDEPIKIINEAIAAGITQELFHICAVSREDVPLYLSITDVSIFFIKPTFSKIASSPTRHAELMSMGIPVICNDIGDTGKIIEESGTGILIQEFSNAKYNVAINVLPELLKVSKEKIRDYAFKYFNLEVGIEKYSIVYKQLLENDNKYN